MTALNLHGLEGSDTFTLKASTSAAHTVKGGTSADTIDYDAESHAVTGDTTPPDTITSPGVQSVTFSNVETVNISNPQPTIAISNVTVAEGGTPASADFNMSLSHASSLTVTVNFATASGTATAPGDYASQSGTVTFVPGDTLETISVPVTNDATPEPTETFVVNLSGAVNATISDTPGHLGTMTATCGATSPSSGA